jgi:glycosyltransferase EpsD
MLMYQKYNYYISTSGFEGNPKTILEAMVSGCIVIASDIPNHAELIENGLNGFLFDLKNPNLQELLESLKSNSLIKNISNQAAETIKSSHSINKISADYMNDYKTLI